MPFLILLLLIVVHELGHFLMALFFKIEVDKIYIYPFGGVSKFYISLNENILKEFIILLMGPLFQILFYFIIIHIDYFHNYQSLIKVYHYTILFFNLLPIFPLDGGKLLNIFLSLNLSFKKSLDISIYISYFTIVIFAIYIFSKDLSFNAVIVISFLIYKVNLEFKKKGYLFDKFLLERYLYHYQFKKRKSVDDIQKFMRGKYHLVKKGDRYYTERDILERKFSNKY